MKSDIWMKGLNVGMCYTAITYKCGFEKIYLLFNTTVFKLDRKSYIFILFEVQSLCMTVKVLSQLYKYYWNLFVHELLVSITTTNLTILTFILPPKILNKSVESILCHVIDYFSNIAFKLHHVNYLHHLKTLENLNKKSFQINSTSPLNYIM